MSEENKPCTELSSSEVSHNHSLALNSEIGLNSYLSGDGLDPFDETSHIPPLDQSQSEHIPLLPNSVSEMLFQNEIGPPIPNDPQPIIEQVPPLTNALEEVQSLDANATTNRKKPLINEYRDEINQNSRLKATYRQNSKKHWKSQKKSTKSKKPKSQMKLARGQVCANCERKDSNEQQLHFCVTCEDVYHNTCLVKIIPKLI